MHYCVEVLKQGKKLVDESLAPLRVQKAKRQAELAMAELDEAIASQKVALLELCSDEELNFKAIIKAQDTLALAGRQKEQYQTILDEMFPAEKK